MSALRFVDTNVLLYSVSLEPEEAAKATIAVALLESVDVVLSVQVLQEFYVQATRPSRPAPLTHEDAAAFMQKWRRFRIQDVTLGVLDSALALKARYSLSYWDAAILAAAQIAGCREVLSEDLADGQRYGDVWVVNPFLAK